MYVSKFDINLDYRIKHKPSFIVLLQNLIMYHFKRRRLITSIHYLITNLVIINSIGILTNRDSSYDLRAVRHGCRS